MLREFCGRASNQCTGSGALLLILSKKHQTPFNTTGRTPKATGTRALPVVVKGVLND
jgi:hypothetical protein